MNKHIKYFCVSIAVFLINLPVASGGTGLQIPSLIRLESAD